MKRILVMAVFIQFVGSASPTWSGQDKDTVLLRWNVPEGKAVGFKASMTATTSATAMQFDFDTLSKLAGTTPPPKETREKMKAFFDGFKLPKELSMTALFKRPANGDIAFLLIAGKMPELQTPVPEFTEMMKKMAGTVQLRAQIDSSGDVTSFWLTPHQKNLVILFSELPRNPVKVGDRWPIKVSFIQMGHGFIAEKSGRFNEVELAAIHKEPDGEVVAVLDYLISENVEGEFQMGDQAKATTMSMSFAGRGRFSVTKGHWKSYAGRMKTKSTGMMASSADQEIALEPLPSVPEEMQKLK